MASKQLVCARRHVFQHLVPCSPCYNFKIIPADQDRGEKGRGVKTNTFIRKGSYIVHYDRCLKKTSKCDPKSDYIYDCKDGFS